MSHPATYKGPLPDHLRPAEKAKRIGPATSQGGALKLLIGAACVSVIAFTGYYFYGEWSEARAIAAEEERLEGVRAELFRFAEAAPHETEKVRGYCRRLDQSTERGGSLADNEVATALVRNCRYFDFL